MFFNWVEMMCGRHWHFIHLFTVVWDFEMTQKTGYESISRISPCLSRQLSMKSLLSWLLKRRELVKKINNFASSFDKGMNFNDSQYFSQVEHMLIIKLRSMKSVPSEVKPSTREFWSELSSSFFPSHRTVFVQCFSSTKTPRRWSFSA